MEQGDAIPIQTDAPRPLAAYRVVELPGAPQLPAGKAFADLGAEVIKVEPPGGDPARTLPPLALGSDGTETGLYWAAYSLGKRSVTADLETEAGRDFVRRLIGTADVVIESNPPGTLDRYGLSYTRLHEQNPGLVLTSISPFGQTGPYADRRGSDLVQLAMSGYLYMTGPKGDTPIKPSAPYQTYLHGSMQAVAATLLALRQRTSTGLGAHVDQAMRDTGMWMLTHTYQFWDLLGINLSRQGAQRDMGGALRLPTVFRCADGYVVWLFQTGHIGGKNTRAMVAWMAEQGMAPDWLQEQDWDTFDLITAGPEMAARLAETFGAYLLTKRKAELFEWAIGRGIMLAPVQTLRDLTEDVQLASRKSWRTLDLDGDRGHVCVPGPPIRLSDGAWEPRGAPPAVGEHNDAVVGAALTPDPSPAGAGEGSLTHAGRTSISSQLPEREPQGHAVQPTSRGTPPLPSRRERGRRERSEPGEGRPLPLMGLRVLDFSTTVAGPSAVRHLADFGAQVIKIESEAHPDTLRFATPYREGTAGLNRSGYFAAYNAGKLSMALNMQLPEARNVVRRLIERSDVLVEAFVPGVFARWGFTYEQVSAWNPRMIMASHCLQGQTGPHARHRGYGQIASAMSGWYDLTGIEGEEPLGPYSAYTDFISWPFLLSAILVALDVRDATGRGQYIDHAQLETSAHFLTPLLLDLQLNDRMATRRGNHEDYASPNNAYRCLGDDRWIAITVTTDAEWTALCATFGNEAAASDPRFATLPDRKEHEDELDRLVTAWTIEQEPFALAERLQSAGIAAGVVERAQDLFEDPQLQHRRFFRRVDHPELGNHAVHGQSFRISGLDPGPFRAAPLLGEHTFDICRDVLGMTEAEITEFTALGIFQ